MGPRRRHPGGGAQIASSGGPEHPGRHPGAHPGDGHPGAGHPAADHPQAADPRPATTHVAAAEPSPQAHAAPAAGHVAAHPAAHHHAHHEHTGQSDHVKLVSLNGADLQATAEALRRWADELDAVAARTGTIRGGLGVASIQASVDDIVGRQVTELTGLAGELRDEAAELVIRAQLAEDDLSTPPAPPARGGTPAPAPAPAPPAGGTAQPEDESLLERIADALGSVDPRRTEGS